MSTPKPRAVSYNRVSTEEEKQLNALAKQIQENRGIIKQKDWELIYEYTDSGKSGTQTSKREAYNQLCRDMEKDIYDIIVIKDQDRLMRNPRDWYLFLDKLLKNGRKLYIHLDNTFYTPDNALLSGIKAILAEEYSRHLSRKINHAHKNRQEKGSAVILTSQTWGYQKMPDGSVQIDEKERALIELIFKMYAQGRGSRLICQELSNRGMQNRKGNTFAESQIRAIVRNPLYMGRAVMNKTHINFDTKQREKIPEAEWKYHENIVPPIVSQELWRTANQTMDANQKKLGGKVVGMKTGSHIFSGKVSGGECGHKFWRNQRNYRSSVKENFLLKVQESIRENVHEKSIPESSGTTKAVYWYCSEYYRYGKKEERSENGCSSLRLKEELYSILQEIGKSLFVKKSQDILRHNILKKIQLILADNNSADSGEALKTAKENLLIKKERLPDLLVDGILSRQDYQKRLAEITQCLNGIESRAIKSREIKNQERGNKETKNKETKNKEINAPICRHENDRIKIDSLLKGLPEQVLDLSVPLVAVHIEQIKVFATRIDIYLDFPDYPHPVTALPETKPTPSTMTINISQSKTGRVFRLDYVAAAAPDAYA